MGKGASRPRAGREPEHGRRGAARRDGKTYRVVADHLGSPVMVVNVDDVTDVPYSAEYEAFGGVTGTGLGWMPFGFAGGIYDEDTGLVRFGARDYLPTVGRWASKDPIRFARDGANLWVYALNGPTNYRDPEGTCVPCFFIGVGLIFGLSGCDYFFDRADDKIPCKSARDAQKKAKEVCGGNLPDLGVCREGQPVPLGSSCDANKGKHGATREGETTEDCKLARIKVEREKVRCATGR